MTTGTRGEPLTHHVMRRAGCPLVAQDCDLNDLSHILLDWASWGPGGAAQAQTWATAFNYSVLKFVPEDVIASGQGWLDSLLESLQELENTESERPRKGARGLVFLWTAHQEDFSLWPNYVRFVLQLKAILLFEMSPIELNTSALIISGEYRPPSPLLGSLLLVQTKV